jgi:predicted secreted acid phosphatase
MIVILDIDGTIANNDHRAHHVDGDKKDWTEFLKPHLVAKDVLIEGAQRAIEHFQLLNYKLMFLTARNESLRETTTLWIHEKLGVDVNDDSLIMRGAGNLMTAAAYKREQAQNLKSQYPTETFLFIDDDKYSWEGYADIGIVLRAPECWDTIFPTTTEVEPVDVWRK